MRSENGKNFVKVIGIVDRARDTGEEFRPNVLKSEKPLFVGDSLEVGGKVFQYNGENSLGCSIFIGFGSRK